MDVHAQTAAWFHRHHDQEHDMSTPAAPRNPLADIADGVNELIRNPRVAHLVGEGLGRNLTPDDAEHVVGIVRAIEAARQPLPQRQPDSTPQPA